MRDLSQKQFDMRCKNLGFKKLGFLGYYDLGPSCQNVHVSIHNAGPKRRDQLRYLVEQRDKIRKREVKKNDQLESTHKN